MWWWRFGHYQQKYSSRWRRLNDVEFEATSPEPNGSVVRKLANGLDCVCLLLVYGVYKIVDHRSVVFCGIKYIGNY